MKKKIAIAVDGSIHGANAIRYAAALSQTLPDLNYVLLNIQPAVSQYLSQETEGNPQIQAALARLQGNNAKASRQMLEKANQQLLQCGVAPERIELRTRVRVNGLAQDILDVCRASQYDAIVVGRRGLSRMQALITGSVTVNLLAHSQLTPIWMVDGEVSNTKILLAADGSPNSLRALDHLAFMLGGNAQAVLHVIHVSRRFSEIFALDPDKKTKTTAEAALNASTRRQMDLFAVQAKTILLKNGLQENQLHLETLENRSSIAHAILEAAHEGSYGTIVLGRSSAPKSLLIGSIAGKILQKAENSAVWLVP